jgi:hypothetical protein
VACTDEQCGKGSYLCFKHKMEYWRTEGHSGVSIPKHFKAATDGSYTQRELLNETFQGEREGHYELRKV